MFGVLLLTLRLSLGCRPSQFVKLFDEGPFECRLLKLEETGVRVTDELLLVELLVMLLLLQLRFERSGLNLGGSNFGSYIIDPDLRPLFPFPLLELLHCEEDEEEEEEETAELVVVPPLLLSLLFWPSFKTRAEFHLSGLAVGDVP